VDGRAARFLGDTDDRGDGVACEARMAQQLWIAACCAWMEGRRSGGRCGRRGVAADLARWIAAADGKAADCGGLRVEKSRRAGVAGAGSVAADLARRIGRGWKGGGLRGLRVEKSRRARGGQNRPCVDAYTKNIQSSRDISSTLSLLYN
jgi:hypothetical protein